MVSEQWLPVVARLSKVIAGLRYPEHVIVSELDPPLEEGRCRYIQFAEYSMFVRSGWRWSRARYLMCECVGATSFGGDVPLTVEQDAAIRALGWRLPSDSTIDEPAPSVPNYHRTLPIDEAPYAAMLGAGALEVLGLHPDELDWELPEEDRGRGRRDGAFRWPWRRKE